MAVLIHLLILFFVRPEFFAIFKKSIVDGPSSSGGPTEPQAIIAIPVDVIGDEPEIVEVEETNRPPVESPTSEEDRKTDSQATGIDLDALVDDAQAPLPSTAPGGTTVIPPRPVEITWPETRKLKHCLGLHVDIRIHVGKKGEILELEPVRADHPEDCLRAALDAASKISFEPGRRDGKPVAAWTQIRIDFRRQNR